MLLLLVGGNLPHSSHRRGGLFDVLFFCIFYPHSWVIYDRLRETRNRLRELVRVCDTLLSMRERSSPLFIDHPIVLHVRGEKGEGFRSHYVL